MDRTTEACALEHRPDVKAARLAFEAREAELRLAHARRMPNISLGPLYKLDNEDQVIGGALSIPLPFFNRNQYEITAAMTNLQVGRTELEARTLAVKHEVVAAFARLQLSARQLASYRTTYLSHLTESTAYARKAYEAGELSIFEFSVTLDRLVQTRFRYLDATLAYLQAKAELDAQTAFQCVDTERAETQGQQSGKEREEPPESRRIVNNPSPHCSAGGGAIKDTRHDPCESLSRPAPPLHRCDAALLRVRWGEPCLALGSPVCSLRHHEQNQLCYAWRVLSTLILCPSLPRRP